MTKNQSQPDLAPVNSPSSLNKLIDFFLDPRRRLSLNKMLALMIVIGLLRRVWRYAVGFPLWGDESFVAINFYVRDYSQMLEPLVFGQIVPLGFMWSTEAVTQLFGYSEWALRLIAALSGLAGFVVYARFCTKYLSPMAAVLAIAFMAPAYYVVRHTAEVKAYSTDLLLATMLISATWRLVKVPTCRTAWGVLILLSLIGPWCSYPFVFVAGGAGLTLAVKFMVQEKLQHKMAATLTLLFGLLLSGSFAAMYVLYASPHAQVAKDLIAIDLWAQTWPPLAKIWLLPVWFIQIHTGHLFAFPHGGMAPFSGITFLCFLAGVTYFWKRQPLLVVLLVSPFLLNILAAAAHAYPYGAAQRISQHLAPAICILAGQGALVLAQRLLCSHRLVRFFAGSFVVGGAAYGLTACVVDVVQPYATIDSHRSHQAVRELAELSNPDDQWIIFNAAEPVEHAPWLGDWRGIGAVFAFDTLRFSHQPPIWSPPPSEVDWPAERGDVWLLVYWAVHNRKLPVFPQAQLDTYIADTNSRLGEPAEIQQWLVKGPGRKHEIIYAYHYARPAGNSATRP